MLLHLLLAATTVDAPILVTATTTGTINVILAGATIHVGSLTATDVFAAGDWSNFLSSSINQASF